MTPPTYLEQDFEEHIEQYLLNSGYYKQHPANYDKGNCLIPEEVIKFIRTSQPKEYKKLQKQFGASKA
jgi:type I restriction enzyme R subunit